MKIQLATWHTPNWSSTNQIHCRGHLIDSTGKIYQHAELCQLLGRVKSRNDLEQILEGASGHFAIIIELDNEVLAAVDHASTIPLYYSDTCISDDALAIPSARETPEDAKSQYLLSGYLIGNRTLYDDVFIIPAGNILTLRKDQPQASLHQYYTYSHTEGSQQSETTMFDRLDEVHYQAIQRLIQHADGRQIAIPLSGGYDSRLVALMLKQLGYNNLLAYSYGNPRSRETHVSKAVAAHLGIPYHFVVITAKDWFEGYQSDERKDYYLKCGMIAGKPYMQDWLAVRSLKKKGVLHADAIITPGHSGDFLEGTLIPALFVERDELDRETVLNQIYKQAYRRWPHSDKYSREIKQQISSYLQLPERMNGEAAASFLEQFFWQHLQAKNYLSGTLIYEFFGFGWTLPWWDKGLLEYWRRVPLNLRYKRQLYKRYVQERQHIDIPVYYKQYLPVRAYEWYMRRKSGHAYDARWHRFADLRKDKDVRVQSLIPAGVTLPGFIDPQTRIADCDLNGLQALVALVTILQRSAP